MDALWEDELKKYTTELGKERAAKIDSAVHEMLNDKLERGVLVIESEEGFLLHVGLNEAIPYGMVQIIKGVLSNDGTIPSPTEGG